MDTGWRFLMSVIWQYAAFCLTALQQINTSDRNKAHFSNSALPFSIGAREVQPKMIRAYKQSFDKLLQLKCADVLYVVGVGEHVDRLNLGKSVSVLNEIFNVACLRVGVAGDVDDALRCQAASRTKELLI